MPAAKPKSLNQDLFVFVAIILFPIAYSWMTLKSGWSWLSRAFAFTWLVLWISFAVWLGSVPGPHHVAPPTATLPPSPPPAATNTVSPKEVITAAFSARKFSDHIGLLRAPCDDQAQQATRMASITPPGGDGANALFTTFSSAAGACQNVSSELSAIDVTTVFQGDQRDAVRNAIADLSNAYWVRGTALQEYADHSSDPSPGPVTHGHEAKVIQRQIDTAALELQQAIFGSDPHV